MPQDHTSLDPLPYYKWHWLRWRASRKVQRMSILERGIYHELLDEQWAEGCVCDSSLSDILGDSKSILASAKQMLTICFTEISPGVWQNETLEEQRTELDTIRSKRKIAGVLGGKAKVESVASAKQMLASASKCHIEEKRREEERRETTTTTPSLLPTEIPKETPKKRRSKSPMISGYAESTRKVVESILEGWPTKQPDKSIIHIDRADLAAKIDALLLQPGIEPNALIESANSYLSENRYKWKAPQWFFGAGQGDGAHWLKYARMNTEEGQNVSHRGSDSRLF